MYSTICVIVWVLLTLAAMVLPLIGPFRRWMLNQMEDDDNPIWDYLAWLEQGIDTPMEALGLVAGWFFVSLIFCVVAVIVAAVWPLVLLLVPMTFLFYKLFKQK